MKSIFLLFAITYFGLSMAFAQSSNFRYTVRGEISDIKRPVKMVLFSVDQSVLRMDSCMSTAAGTFELKGTVNIPVKATVTYVEPNVDAITVVGQQPNGRTLLFLEPGEIQITGLSLDSAKVSSGKGQKEFEDLLKRQQASEEDSVNFNFIQSHPSSYVSLWLLKSYTRRAKPELLAELFNNLDKPIRESEAGLMVEGFVKVALLTAIGRPATEINIMDSSEKPITLAQFKGKLLLIDFWASWCGPCRLENKNVVKVYQKYAVKGFEVLGISLDMQKDKWLKALEEDKLPWRQVCDQKQEIAKMYGIRSLPQNVLIDASGTIIAKNLKGDDLEAKLKVLLGAR